MTNHNNQWAKVYKNVLNTIDKQKVDTLFFRGHSDASWELKPSLARLTLDDIEHKEQCCYFDFITRAGDLLPEKSSSWKVALTMQHHGLPTRLLDWSENFATALYFAIKDASNDCCIWILNPYRLNNISFGREEIPHPEELQGEYSEYFISKNKEFIDGVVAFSPLRHHPRVFKQRSGFTVHSELESSIEEKYKDALTKITIPKEAHEDAKKFLFLAGVTEFSLFPDLDGLSRELKNELFKI